MCVCVCVLNQLSQNVKLKDHMSTEHEVRTDYHCVCVHSVYGAAGLSSVWITRCGLSSLRTVCVPLMMRAGATAGVTDRDTGLSH